jgi:hypothetical protein
MAGKRGDSSIGIEVEASLATGLRGAAGATGVALEKRK